MNEDIRKKKIRFITIKKDIINNNRKGKGKAINENNIIIPKKNKLIIDRSKVMKIRKRNDEEDYLEKKVGEIKELINNLKVI